MTKEETKAAIASAYDYLRQAQSASGITSDKVTSFRVEEAGKDDDGTFRITLSYEVIGDFPFDRKKEFKDFVLSSDGTTVISMKIRTI
jgi:hypothetical protein